MGSFVFIVLVLGFIWIVRGLAKAEQRRQLARQAGFTEEEINRIDQKNLAIQTFLAGLIVGPATFIGMIFLTCLLVWVLFPVGLLATLVLWSLYLKWLRSFYRGNCYVRIARHDRCWVRQHGRAGTRAGSGIDNENGPGPRTQHRTPRAGLRSSGRVPGDF